LTAWNAERSGVCSSGQLITLSPLLTRRKLLEPSAQWMWRLTSKKTTRGQSRIASSADTT
jgi:hypothetical protein